MTDDAGAGSADAITANQSDGQSLIWVSADYANSLASIASNGASFTHVSPALYQVNYAYSTGVASWWNHTNDDFDGLASAQIAEKIHAAGLKIVPLVLAGAGNGGTDDGIHNIITDTPLGTRDSFISSMVDEAVAKGYDGYNLDWEFDSKQTTYAAYGPSLDSFLAAFKTALHAHGMQLSFDLGSGYLKQSACSGGKGVVDLTTIGANVDLAIIKDYASTLGTPSSSCPTSLPDPQLCTGDFMSVLDLMCVYVQKGAIGVGLDAKAVSGSNPIAVGVVEAMKAYGFRNIAVSADSSANGAHGASVLLDSNGIQATNWFKLLADFLAAQR